MIAQWGLRRGSAFTLLELIVVLAVLSLVAAVVIPSLSSGSRAELRATAGKLAAGLRQNRNRAITRSQATVFQLDVGERKYAVGENGPLRSLPDGMELSLYTARSEVLNERSGVIRFFPDGSSTGGRISVSSAGRAYLVDVDWLTGKVRILESAQGEDA